MASSGDVGARPRVLILGGLGVIGRTLTLYMVSNDLASAIRVVDKRVPEMCYLSPQFLAAFRHPCVEVIQADLSLQNHVDRAFTGPPFSIVINLAAETRYGHFDAIYARSILQLRTLCAQKAAQMGGCEKYLEVSTGQVYESKNEKPSKESSGKVKPWTTIAKYHLQAEQAVSSLAALPWVIVRLPMVYGPGDVLGMMPRIVCASVYEHTKETMRFLWGKDLRVHTIHVQDVAAALWHLVCVGVEHEVYNVVDDNDTTQGRLNSVLEKIFALKTGFYGAIMSNLAELKLDELVEEANEGHMGPWNDLLRNKGIDVTPLTPFLEPELLYNHPLCMDGSKLKALGFQCSCPNVTEALVRDSINYWIELGLFPQ